MNFRKTTAFFVAVITCLFFFGMTGAMAAEPYNLGVALGLTGAGALYSADGVEGIKLAVEEINAKGGLLGQHKIELFIRDSQTKPDVGVREVKDLILRDKIRAVINDYSSAVAMAVKPIAQEYKVLHIASISNSENITMINPSPYTFQVVPNSYMQAKAAAVAIAKMAKQKGWKEYITIASDYEWGRSTQASAVKFLKETSPDLTLKKEFWPRLGETQFTSYITGIMASKPDFVLGSVASNDNVAWMEQAKNYGFFDKIPYPGSLITVTELMLQAKTLTRGIIALTRAPFFAHMDNPMMADFVKNYRAKYNKYPSDWAVLCYDAVYALKQGVEKAKTIDTEKVKDAMKGMTVDLTRGRLTFRTIDNQLSCSSYTGTIADDPRYPFPIYKDIIEIKGSESERPESEILEARKAK
ncbi:MAG: ABC transporter substrate-binding protein [Proteobacteria bacterium]|nr:ABC transporter substrate-binding protein [Pseudomonadota bacterium]MBU1570487.1 ABC transporter substrate-binding protein [Pseudomonadota bacterium]